jgi:hypothetical protein
MTGVKLISTAEGANRDDKYDYDEYSVECGLFGINIHKASEWGIVNYVNKFSTGCQVLRIRRVLRS